VNRLQFLKTLGISTASIPFLDRIFRESKRLNLLPKRLEGQAICITTPLPDTYQCHITTLLPDNSIKDYVLELTSDDMSFSNDTMVLTKIPEGEKILDCKVFPIKNFETLG
jgi:hypothetical protein